MSVLSFGEFTLDPSGGQLTRAGTPIPLPPKAFALLHHLARHAGRLILKDELLATVWPGVFVGDAVLKSTIRELRKTLRDDPAHPTFIKTVHRRGYRFIAVTTSASSEAHATPTVHYARSGDANIAYQVVGSGPVDLVFVMGWVSHLEYFWNNPSFAQFLSRLASQTRLILFDKRGTGLSDPVPISQLPSLEQRLDDVRAVMEAVGSARAVLFGVSEGGPLCSLFAATYPERTEALVIFGSYARRLRAPDYPWGSTREDRDRFCDTIIKEWGGPVGIEERAPSMADDPAFRAWWASYLRMGASPGAAVALTRMNAEIDIREVLPSVRVPALVIHRTGDRCMHVEEGRYLAGRIPEAGFVELPGDDHLPFVGDQDQLFAALEPFLATVKQQRTPSAPPDALGSVLTVLSNSSPTDRAYLARTFEREAAFFRGRVVASSSPALVAVFDGPARAVQCGLSVVALARQSRIDARAGIHLGQHDVSAALAGTAAPHAVHVSRSVVDLLPGSGVTCEPRGDAFMAVPG